MKIFTISALIFIALTQTVLAYDEAWKIKEIKETQITEGQYSFPFETHIEFNNGKKFDTNIKEFKLLGTIFSDENIPFLIFSGRDCTECDANTAIYIHSPLDGYLDGRNGEHRYSYPGKLSYYQDDSLLSNDRLFYGNCLSEKKKNAVWYMHYLGNDNEWHDRIFVVNFVKTKRVNSDIKYDPFSLDKTLDYVKQGICKEVPGIDMTSEP